jgi:two-component system cell cycle sensor histidine kinase/response regulator CckA
MKQRAPATLDSGELRRRAEARLDSAALTVIPEDAELGGLVRELQVYQVELELQNEELRHTELELAASRDRYRSLYDHAPVGYVTLDAGGLIVDANLTLCKRLGCERAAVLGRPLSAFMSERHADALHLHLRAVLGGGGAPVLEVELTHASGAALPARLESTASDDPVVGRRLVLTAVVELTPEDRLEGALRQASKLEAVDTLAAGIAHDFRNVLHAIAGCVAVAAREPELPGRVGEYLGEIRNATRRGAALTDQLTAFSRRRDRDEPQPLVLDPFIEETFPLLMRLVGEQIRMELQLGAPRATIMADPVQLERILMNLASNACGAMPEGGTLELRTDAVTFAEDDPRQPLPGMVGPHVRLTVRDTGTGIDDVTRQRIFEPFFTTKGVGKGTGLGLSAVFSITHKLGGHVEVDSTLGAGTTFTFWLPRCGDASEREPSGPHATASLSGLALLVEDDPLVRMSIRNDLEHLGMQVVEACDPRSALASIDTLPAPPNLLVADVMLPGMTGARLAEQLRARLPVLRVLLVSAHASEDLIERGTLPPGSTVLRKPFDQAVLAQRVLEVLDTPHDIPPAAGAGASPATILLVDDDEGGRTMLATLLEYQGLHVLTAASPSEALVVARAHPGSIDVLVTDVNLPQMQGDELARRVRALRPAVGVLFVSGGPSSPEIEREGELLLKPVSVDQLVQHVRRLVG